MFNKDLFLSLCEKYNVELSNAATAPMIKEGDQIRMLTQDDINRIFSPHQTYFDYSNNKLNVKVESPAFYPQEIFAIAC